MQICVGRSDSLFRKRVRQRDRGIERKRGKERERRGCGREEEREEDRLRERERHRERKIGKERGRARERASERGRNIEVLLQVVTVMVIPGNFREIGLSFVAGLIKTVMQP